MAKKNSVVESDENTSQIDTPYDLPEDWEWVKLGDYVSIVTGKKDANYGTVNGKYLFFTCAGEPLQCDNYSFSGESLLLPGNGANVGQVFYYDGQFEAYQRTYVLQKKNEKLFLKYLYYHLLAFWNLYNKDKQFGSATSYIKMGNFLEYLFPFPPTIEEQQYIVNRIESMFAKLDEAKEKAQNVVDSFETRKAAILHQAFTGNLTAKWRKENGVSDDSLEEKLFDSCIAKMQNGLSKRSGEEGEETVVLRLANIGENDFDVSDLRTIKLTSKEQENYSLIKDDVVMIRVNGSKANVGRQILVKNNNGWSFCDHIIRIKFESFCLPNYMVYYSNTKEYKDYVQDNMVSSAGQNTISRKGLSNLTLKIPTLSEQQEIVRVLDSVFEKECIAKSAAEQVLEQIDLLKKSILARAFRGEL